MMNDVIIVDVAAAKKAKRTVSLPFCVACLMKGVCFLGPKTPAADAD